MSRGWSYRRECYERIGKRNLVGKVGAKPLPLLLLLGGVYGGRVGLVGQGEAQGEPVGCRGDGEGVGAHEWHVAPPLVVGLEGDEATQLIFGILSRAHRGWGYVI